MNDRQREELKYTRGELGKYLKTLRKEAGFSLLSISEKIHELYPERAVSTIKLNYLPSLEDRSVGVGWRDAEENWMKARGMVADLYLKLVIKDREQYKNVRNFLRKIEEIKNEIKNEQERPNYDEKLLKLPVEIRKPLEELIDSLYKNY